MAYSQIDNKEEEVVRTLDENSAINSTVDNLEGLVNSYCNVFLKVDMSSLKAS